MSNPVYIPRPSYLNKVLPYIGKPIIKVFTGQRRSGKSCILLQTLDEVKNRFPEGNLIYINMELPDYNEISDENSLLEYFKNRKVENRKNFLFIDEIQEIPGFEKALRGLLAEGETDIYCTGSNAVMLSGELATLLSGRYIEIMVHALSYDEFCIFHHVDKSVQSLMKYMSEGGMPFMIHLDDDILVRQEYLRNVMNTILYKDVVQRFNVRNYTFLQNLMSFLADNIGSLVSANRISEYLKSQKVTVSVTTILDYLHFLESSYLIHKVKRYDITGKRLFELNDKYYFEDLGLRHTLKAYDPKEISKYMENMVFRHLLKNDYQVFVGKFGDKEIDFIGRRNDDIIYVQVTLSVAETDTFNREFGNLLLINDNYRKYVVTFDDFAGGSHKGIQFMHLGEFLVTAI